MAVGGVFVRQCLPKLARMTVARTARRRIQSLPSARLFCGLAGFERDAIDPCTGRNSESLDDFGGKIICVESGFTGDLAKFFIAVGNFGACRVNHENPSTG